LGYACTVHKFQGSEYKVVLWGLDDSAGAMRLGCRELFYTGLSRGKFFVKHFGKKHTADSMCVRRSITKRKTFLRELIEGTVK
jgi:ATP-dependent exoDNAse (exonuclease V) alpha subunit